MGMRHLHLDPKYGQVPSGFSHTSFFCLSAPCYYQPVGNHSSPSSWLSGAACCGSALYQTSASKPCSPKRQEDVSGLLLGWLPPKDIVSACLMRRVCHPSVPHRAICKQRGTASEQSFFFSLHFYGLADG